MKRRKKAGRGFGGGSLTKRCERDGAYCSLLGQYGHERSELNLELLAWANKHTMRSLAPFSEVKLVSSWEKGISRLA